MDMVSNVLGSPMMSGEQERADDIPPFESASESFVKKIDIGPYSRIGNNKALMDIILTDRTTGSNLLWATDDYSSFGPGFGKYDRIKYLFIINPNRIIRPRYLKSQSEKRNRSKEKAEVFTPPWIVNKQNNLVDDQWFGRSGAFNTEIGRGWIPTSHVDFGDIDWKSYITSTRLEVSCGEAPYLTSRYDPVDGTEIPVPYRVGFLDRKLRVVSEKVDSPKGWVEMAKAAVKSVYGYDLQGDNVILARENLLLTVMEHYSSKFGEEMDPSDVLDIAFILSWNIWQMDGLTCMVPSSGHNGKLDAEFSVPSRKSSGDPYCKIMDWDATVPSEVKFSSLKKDSKSRGRPVVSDSYGNVLERYL